MKLFEFCLSRLFYKISPVLQIYGSVQRTSFYTFSEGLGLKPHQKTCKIKKYSADLKLRQSVGKPRGYRGEWSP